MAQIKVTNWQYPLVLNVELNPADIGQELAVDVPPGFVLTGGALAVREVFNGTTPTVDIVDNKSSPVTYLNDTSLAAVAATAFSTGLYTEYPNGGKIRILPVIAGGATTAGRADVLIQGIVRGRQNERIGANIAT